ncbi:hypothetical protein Q4519_05750 [Motilimonas sp. 1_MG-2023]|uniref:5' nucleotidase, NT5C type n=1 Tax=Motilimonas sp. 1_MG-2023 TaxID=3062672 RepID=UPI0026E40F18|nr:hypothetical protein [Motilimonas sp. 1_MG-2023]MDO6525183.1 hypothetical protein [Motilimonas sp. 1_MG-2023]
MIVYIDMDDVLCDFSRAFQRAIAHTPQIQFPQSQYGFYTALEPIEGAIEAVNALIESSSYTPYILTAPSVRNPLCYTEKRVWVERYFGLDFAEKLIICSNKGLLKGDYLIDDKSKGRGQEGFTGELIQFGQAPFQDWQEVRKYLRF